MCFSRYKRLVSFVVVFMTSCVQGPGNGFEKIVGDVDRFFAEKPTFVTFVPSTDTGDSTSYYAINIVDYTLTHETIETGSTVSPYKSFIRISCSTLDNASSGDIEMKASGITHYLDSDQLLGGAVGFSTTEMALRNTDFSNPSEIVFLVKYNYRNSRWFFNTLEISFAPASFVHALKEFPQNDKFRRVFQIPG